MSLSIVIKNLKPTKVKVFILSALMISAVFTGCDSNIETEDRTEERADSLSNVLETHNEEIEELTGSIDEKLEEINAKLNTDDKENI